MRIAAVDIGTNTILLLIADVDDNGNIHLLDHQQQFPRLGSNVDGSQIINPEIFDKVASIINDYKTISHNLRVDSFIVCATSAVRDAANQNIFLDFIESECGCKIMVLSGKEEAELTFLGGTSGFRFPPEETVVLDIGGGSTEITQYISGELKGESLQIGAVRLTERFFLHSPPTNLEIKSAKEDIAAHLSLIQNPPSSLKFVVGVAGTLTTLACLAQGIKHFQIEKIRGYHLSPRNVDLWTATLLSLVPTEILKLSDATIGRVDIIGTGALILDEMIKKFGFQDIIVSERGLRHGMVLKEWKIKSELE
ncbi:MAG: Ppx/GppA family phosphatase [Chlorobiaceae bacterium]|nr:Ppx/GppA family phosphatase [Chlorobiaceae bacterium]